LLSEALADDPPCCREIPGAAALLRITGCRYADFFRALGEPELGAVLLCEADNHMVEVGSPEVEMTRTQTIMKGAKYCEFRYRMKAVQGSKPGAA
jgi:hypothetical protein